MAQPDTTRDWVVTLHPGTEPHAAAQRLRQAGLQVQDVLDVIGVITGRATASQAQRCRGLPGVADVAATPAADVGPPDAELG